MLNNLDIFICTHKDFKPIVANKAYKIISQEGLTITDTNGLDVYYETDIPNVSNEQLAWSEVSRIYYIWKKYNVKDYIGFCHYRRYFDFLDNADYVLETLKEYDLICAGTINEHFTVYEDWNYYHNINDLLDICKIANKLYNIDLSILQNFLNSTPRNHFNMFIMPKHLFNEYCDFIFSIIEEFKKKYNLTDLNSIQTRIINNYDDYIHIGRTYSDVTSQMRLYGFIAEFLLQLFIMYKSLNVKECNIITT